MGPASTGNATGTDMTPTHRQRKMTPRDIDDAIRIESVLIRKPPLSFEEIVDEYRKIEGELLGRAGVDEFDATETRRRIAEWTLTAASWLEQPFDVCQKAWNDLLAVGFSSLLMKCSMGCVYADCCWMNEQDEAGLAVVEPLITELEQWLAETTLAPAWRADYDSALAGLKKRRNELRGGTQE